MKPLLLIVLSLITFGIILGATVTWTYMCFSTGAVYHAR